MSGSCGWFPMRQEEIIAWVEAHRDALPQTVGELAAFPVAFRKVIVNSVSPDRRIAFWREHLESFLGPASTLSVDQRALIADAIADLPLMLGGDRAVFEARARSLEERMKVLLTREQAARMFGMVGPPEPPEGLPLPPDAMPSAPSR